MLQIKEAHAAYLRDMKGIGQALYKLADAHKATPMAGRSHGVQALPITFGHKAAIWLSEMGRNYQRLRGLESRMFVGGMVGAVGTQASYGPKAQELERRLMKRLGLGVADINWQPARDRFAEYVCVLAIIGQTLGKIANEIIILEHTEIGEVFEPFSEGKVGSSTMPHKRNPSSCEAVVGVSRGLRYNAAFMLECMMVEHERDGSAWRGEWKALPESCLMAGGLLAAMNYVLSGLHVDAGRMRRNLDLLGGFLLSERVMFALSEKVGKQTAHDLVYEASMHGIEGGLSFEQALMQDQRVARALTPEELRKALDPTTYVGLAPQIVDQVLAAMNYVLSGLHVDAGRMRKNLDALGGFLLSERVMFALSEKIGKQTAHDLVYEASMHGIEGGLSFEQALMQDSRVAAALTPGELRRTLDPTTYVGLAPRIVDQVLAATRASGWLD